jgi:hypothetical protein
MIRVHTETPMHEDYVDYPTGIEYSFTANNDWLGIFDENKKLIASFNARWVVRVETLDSSIEPEF